MKNILIVHDISCFGKCSTTVALPIISAFGHTGSILPTSILSTHTGPDFPGFVVTDLFEHMQATVNHWVELGIKFDAIYTGYLGQEEHIHLLLDAIPSLLKENGKVIVDPVFADEGDFYPAFDQSYADALKELVAVSDYAVPNITEASLMLRHDFSQLSQEPLMQEKILDELIALGAKNAVLTGIRRGEKIGALAKQAGGKPVEILSKYIPEAFHGTGDVFCSVFTGELMRNGDAKKAVKLAVEFVPKTIQATLDEHPPIHYAVHFEKLLPFLIER